MTNRKPDYVFDVWSDNVMACVGGAPPCPQDLLKVKDRLRLSNRGQWVTHRIRVYLKAKA